MYIYLASSWKNQYYPEVLARLREAGFEVYDFRDMPTAFSWEEVSPKWKTWGADEYRSALAHPAAIAGFRNDQEALDMCDTVVLLLPCGRSAHLEAGYALGWAKGVYILAPNGDGLEPELMYKMAGDNNIYTSIAELINRLGRDSHELDAIGEKYNEQVYPGFDKLASCP